MTRSYVNICSRSEKRISGAYANGCGRLPRFLKMITLFFLFVCLIGCAQNETTTRATKGAATSGAIGMAVGGPQRAAVSAASGAATRVIGGKIKDKKEEQDSSRVTPPKSTQ